MYCGDEVFSVIADLGTQTSRFGYAGEDCPKAVFPSAVGHVVEGEKSSSKGKKLPPLVDAEPSHRSTEGWPTHVMGDANLGRRRTDLDLRLPLENGHVRDWDAVEELWRHGFKELSVPDMAKGAPFLYAVPTWATPAESARVMELAFEKFDVGALYLARSPVLSAFSTGRANAIVCDCGAGSTSAVPVLDGFTLNRVGGRSPRGGDWLDEQVAAWLAGKQLSLSTGEGGKGAGAVAPASYRAFQERRLVRDIKESCCMVPQPPTEDGAAMDVPTTAAAAEAGEGGQQQQQQQQQEPCYELPDGTKIMPEPALVKIPELLVAPGPAGTGAASASAGGGGGGGGGGGSSTSTPPQDLSSLVYEAVKASDVDVRKELLGNVLLTGGGSLFRGTPERLQWELAERVPVAYKVKVVAATPVERRFSVWIGGSILASLGSFQQLWLSKAEYEEMGAERACRDRFH